MNQPFVRFKCALAAASKAARSSFASVVIAGSMLAACGASSAGDPERSDTGSNPGVGEAAIAATQTQALDCGPSQVPIMTGSNTPSGIIRRSGAYSAQYEASQAFDGSDDSMWISGVFETPAWIEYEWADGPRTITNYAIDFVNGSLTSRAPKDFTLQGWDGSAWVVVDTRRGETNWRGRERRTYDVATPGSYVKYRLQVTDDNDDRDGVVVVSIGRLELFSCGCTEGALVPTLSGPSSGVTRSGVYSSSYEAFNAFDGNDNSMWISAVYQTPAWIGYEFAGQPRKVTRYAIRFVNGSLTSRAPRDFTLQGWSGSSWVVVDARSGETNWPRVGRREFIVASPGSYSKYRLNVTDDNDTRSGVVVISMGRLELTGCQ